MREEYLHYLFESRYLGNAFKTTSGQSLTIQDFGNLNANAGPDFLNARISVENTIWAGSIEFHVKSSDWFLHGHQHDAGYQNVIAHFVFEHDKEVEINGIKVPTVELRSFVNYEHFEKYRKAISVRSVICCASSLTQIPNIIILQQKDRAIFERLFRKSQRILDKLHDLNGDIEKVFYLTLARVFGGNVNADSFERLLADLDLNIFKKSTKNDFFIPAILLGKASLLPEKSDHHFVSGLIEEFAFQKHRLGLTSISRAAFRFSRMRPPGFPTIRIAQLAKLLEQDIPVGPFSNGQISFSEMRGFFELELNLYWQNHYHFEKEVETKSTQLAAGFIDLIFINALVPFLFAMGTYYGRPELREQAFQYLQKIAAEKNRIVSDWKALGLVAETAYDTQALIEQKNEFCSKKKCLFCAVGNHLLKP